MNLGILSSTRCIAIAFKQEFALAVRTFNIYDVYKSFLNVNVVNTTNPYLSQALKKCLLLGHIEPFVILIGGDEASLRTLKSCWMRAQLQPPPGFRIESIGDAGGLILNSVPQYASMRLEEVIFQVICQVSMVESTCSESRLYGHLANIYAEMQSHLPPRQSIYAAISSLIKSGLIYYCGQGYNLMTPDKMHVANWLRSLPASGYLSTDYRPPSRREVSKASLVLNMPSSSSASQQQEPICQIHQQQKQQTTSSQLPLPRPLNSASSLGRGAGVEDTSEEEPPSFRSSEDQMLFPSSSLSPVPTPPNHNQLSTSGNNLATRLSSQHLQQQISQMKREASSTSRLNVHNRRRLFGGSGSSTSPPTQAPVYPAMGTSSLFPHHYHQPSAIAVEERGISTSTSFNNSLQEHSQQQAHNQQKQQQQQQQQQNSAPSRNGTRDFKRRAQLSQSVYLSSAEPTRQSQTRLGRPLNEQKSSRFAKSADFQSSNLAFGEPTAFQTGELKKHGSNSLLQWFKQGVRKLRNSLHRSISRDDWPARSMPSFPMLYQNTTTANSLTPTMHQPSWASKAAQHQGRLRTATANRGSSGDIYPLHSALPHIDFDRGSSVSNLRRCLSLAENQNREIGSGGAGYGGGNIMPFSMEVIPETDLQASSQNLGPNSYLQRDSTMEQIFAWQQGAPSLLSLNATPNGFNGVEKSSQSDSRQLFQGPAFPDSTNPSGPSFYESRHEPLPANNPTGNNYMARSGRDSGFIDIPSHQNFAQVDSSAYSVIHSRQLSEPQTTQEPLDVKQITDAFEGLASDALKGSPSPPPPPQIPQMVLSQMDSWWASGGFTAVQQNSGALGGGMCQDWNIYQNGIFTSNPSGGGGVGETQSLKAK